MTVPGPLTATAIVPVVGTNRPARAADRRLIIGVVILGVLVLAAVLAPWIAPHDPEAIDSTRLLVGPTLRHPFGTDALGRDVLSRVLYAFRISLLVAAGSIGLAALVGIPIGLLAGYAGGGVDLVLMRPVEMILVVPALLLAISLIAVLGTGTQVTLIAIAVIFFPIVARVMRSSAQVVSTLPFIDASRARGVGGFGVAVRHVLPNAVGPVVVQAAILMGFSMQIEAALSFLGLGTQPPTPSLGLMLYEGRETLVRAPWAGIFPGLAIAVTVLALNLVGDGARRRLVPDGGTG
jgi:peptide/nickel transport system permease protein